MLTVTARTRLGWFDLDAAFASQGGVTALFGRSGSGKTTLVNVIAGLTRPDAGSVTLDDTVLLDTEKGIDVPVHRRHIGYVFQEGRLFPHLSVRGNLNYGAARAGDRRSVPFDDVVALLGIEALLERRPALLSGGEKQRVAIGRALLAGPRLLLMDEPLASLDAQRKAEILPYLELLRDELALPIVYVSHALGEVARLADTLVLLDHGKVTAAGPVGEILARLDLADAIELAGGGAGAGAILTARIAAQDVANRVSRLDHSSGELFHPLIAAPVGTTVRLRVRARDVALAIGDPGLISIRNRLTCVVAEIAERAGGAVDVRLAAGNEALVARITRDAAAALDLAVGQKVVALIKATAFDREDETS
jgi:molybdate transport system ATP-binding protein